MNRNNDAVIVAIGRAPVGKGKKGHFKNTNPVDFAAQTLKGVLEKIPQLDVNEIGDVIVGCAQPQDETGFNVGRMIIQRAGLPDEIPAQTVNRFCSSGLQAIASCANAIMCGQEEVMIAGGVESMSLVDMNQSLPETHNKWLEENRNGYISMGITAENVAVKYKISREEMDAFAVESHRRASFAQETGEFDDQIVPIHITNELGEDIIVTKDQGIRKESTVESLGTLKPSFKKDGVVTAGNSSQVSDGAGFAILMSMKKAKELGIRPIAKFIGYAVGGVDAAYMGLGPIAAVPKVMKKTGMTVDEMDIIELNEAFASQSLKCIRDLKLNKDIVNPYGGAIALGHPMGATGINLTSKALSYLRKTNGRYALITMCIGGGMGAAGIFEMI